MAGSESLIHSQMGGGVPAAIVSIPPPAFCPLFLSTPSRAMQRLRWVPSKAPRGTRNSAAPWPC